MTTTIQMNARGTLTLPKSLRQVLGLEKGGTIVVETSDAGVTMRPAVTFPIELYSDERLAEFDSADKELARHLKRKRK